MPKEDSIEVLGKVVEKFKAGMFSIELDAGRTVLAAMAGRLRRNRIKILYFDGTGVCVLAKRLEEGTFHWPQSAGEPNAKIRLAPQALQLLLDGVDLKAGARRAWYEVAA